MCIIFGVHVPVEQIVKFFGEIITRFSDRICRYIGVNIDIFSQVGRKIFVSRSDIGKTEQLPFCNFEIFVGCR